MDIFSKRRVSGTCRLKIVHSTAQADYVWWKYNQLKRLCATTKPPAEVVKNKTFIPTEPLLFPLLPSLLLFGDIHELFYTPVLKGDRTTFVKTITPELIDKLPMNPLVLTTFFLDDGSVRDDCYAGKLATQGFSKEECELLREYFLKWNINCLVVKHTKESKKHYLSIVASTFCNLIEVISPTVREIPSMVAVQVK
jgi:LAGLIDADG DNA endonuclease family